MNVLNRILSDPEKGRGKKLVSSGMIHNVGCYSPRNVGSYMFMLHGAFGTHTKKAVMNGEAKLQEMIDTIATHGVSDHELKEAIESLQYEWGVEPFENIHTTTMAIGEAIGIGN